MNDRQDLQNAYSELQFSINQLRRLLDTIDSQVAYRSQLTANDVTIMARLLARIHRQLAEIWHQEPTSSTEGEVIDADYEVVDEDKKERNA